VFVDNVLNIKHWTTIVKNTSACWKYLKTKQGKTKGLIKGNIINFEGKNKGLIKYNIINF